MGIIKVLPELIANKIAAGEVIERPASIVKELIENSLDAGARQIEVSIRHGGKSLIRIADDGSGMPAADAELAFQRFATSKISTAEDLTHIGSYGFRGEALASIAAVSRIKLQTRVAASPSGTEVVIEGGALLSVKECPAQPGTVMEVRDLFFNTPGRRKFMKSDATESGHVYETVSHLALSRLDVRFVLKENDKTVFDLLPGETLQKRAATLLSDAAGNLLEFEMAVSGIRIHGLIGKPHAARASRSGQSFFINKRWIRSFSFSYALQAGYHGLLMHGQFPVSVLFVEIDLSRVDVNVHPTKQEVRISNEAEIKSLLKEAVQNRLAAESSLSPQLKDPSKAGERFGGGVPFGRDFSSIQKDAAREEIFFKEVAKSSISETGSSYLVQDARPLDEMILIRNKLGITKILGQIHNTFLIAETEEGLMLLDQHAAHERVMFEALLKNFAEGHPVSQHLLIQETVELLPRQREILREALPFLQKTGFDIDPFSENSFVIRAIPAVFENENPAAVLKAFVEEKEEGNFRTSLENQTEDVAALIACKKKSVRAHDPLTAIQLQALLDRLAGCGNPFACPHGRPTMIRYSFEDLEKQFKRKL